MSSQRFPGKVLAALPTEADPSLTVLDWTLARVRRSRAVTDLVVATSTDTVDDAIAAHCAPRAIAVYRGSRDDVLDRCYRAAVAAGAEVVVRITADCPLVDPEVLAEVVELQERSGAEFAANRRPAPAPRRFPIGLDVEVAELAALERAWREARAPHEREHVMPYLYEVAGRFRTAALDADVDAGDVRWTVDTRADLEAVRELVRRAGATPETPWRTLLEVWRAAPEIAALNAAVEQRDARTIDPRVRP
jgi:spore coat polysaccharide biosynthesis protein SpsF